MAEGGRKMKKDVIPEGTKESHYCEEDLFALDYDNWEEIWSEEPGMSSITVEKTANSDGSYYECMFDPNTNRAEIHVYNELGECIERDYGRFEPYKRISEEELDRYLFELHSKDK